MAWTSGTATGHLDLLDKLVNFLSTDPTLVAANQHWEVLRNGRGAGPFAWPYSRVAVGNTWALSNRTTTAKDAIPSWLIAENNTNFQMLGTLTIADAGNYQFALDGVGSMDLVIDGTNVVRRYGTSDFSNNLTSSVGTITLSAGTHTFWLRGQLNINSGYGISLGMKHPSGSMGLMDISAYLSSVEVYTDASYQGAATLQAEMDTIMTCRSIALRGKGMSNTDNIYVSLLTSQNPTGDYYNVSIRGHTAYDAAAKTTRQPNVTSAYGCLLWDQAIPYWFIANGRRFIVVTKVSTVYSVMYGGLYLPYATPTEYPYPLFIGGSANSATVRWSSNNGDWGGYDAFWDSGAPPSAGFRDPYGNWLHLTNRSSSVYNNDWDDYPGWTYPYFENPGWRTAPDGSYALHPVTLVTEWGRGGVPSTSNSTGGVWGELDGVYHVSGYSNASENIVTVGGVDHLVVQSTYHTGINNYAAIALQ